MTTFLTFALPAVVSVLYGVVSVCYVIRGDWPWAVVWGGYAVANVGLILAAR